MKRAAWLVFLMMAACREDVAANSPDPVAMTDTALGHFCQMALSDMVGPKAQIHLAGMPDPIFFAQVRDGVAYLKEPEKTHEISAIYVSDMSQAESWEIPGEENWISATDAFFVVGAAVTGGMGAPELAPFSNRADADDFVALYGGAVMQIAEVPAAAVLGPLESVELERTE